MVDQYKVEAEYILDPPLDVYVNVSKPGKGQTNMKKGKLIKRQYINNRKGVGCTISSFSKLKCYPTGQTIGVVILLNGTTVRVDINETKRIF